MSDYGLISNFPNSRKDEITSVIEDGFDSLLEICEAYNIDDEPLPEMFGVYLTNGDTHENMCVVTEFWNRLKCKSAN